MSNETEGRSGRRSGGFGIGFDFLAELDAQYPVATWFVKAELVLFLVAVVFSALGEGMLFIPGADVWLFHDFYLMTWVLIWGVGSIGIGTGIIYLLWTFFAN